MASRAATIGDGLATLLNDPSRTWNTADPATPLNARRTYDPVAELEALDVLTVDLVPPPEPEQEVALTRGSEYQDYAFFLLVRKRFGMSGTIPNEAIDPLIDLTEQVASYLRTVELSGMGTGYQVRIESAHVSPQWDPEMLRTQRTYGSGIEIIAREYRAR